MGAALFQEVLTAVQALNAQRLLAEVDGKDAVALGFAIRRGFIQTQQFRTMALEVAGFPFSQFAPLLEHTEARVFAFSEVGDTAENRWKLYELNKRLAPDIPGNGEEFPTFDEYTREVVEADWFPPEGQFIAAVDDHGGERWVGLVGVGFDPARNIASHEFTAVDRQYRGRGIAQALKFKSIVYAAQLGAREPVTGNDALNEAMLAINRKFGYREALGAARLEREL